MILSYIYCNHCGYENTNVFVAYTRSVANGNVYLCPGCDEECLDVVE